MQATALPLEGLWLLEPQVFSDARGFFFESFNHKRFSETIGMQVNFVQDNHSLSHRGTARGLHYQLPPYAQAKLVRVIRGSVLDIALDIRRHSKTFGQWHGVILSAENRLQFWIPHGFAHAFITLKDNTEFLYKSDNFYAPDYERCISLRDPALNITNISNAILPSDCGIDLTKLTLSAKDLSAPLLQNATVFTTVSNAKI